MMMMKSDAAETITALTAAVGADKLQPECPPGVPRLPVEDDVPGLAPGTQAVEGVLGAAAEDEVGEVTSLRLRGSVLGTRSLETKQLNIIHYYEI